MKEIIFLVISLSVAALQPSDSPFNATWNYMQVNPVYHLYWKIDDFQKLLYVGVDYKGSGWVGFGLSQNGGMYGADIALANYDATTNNFTVTDMFSQGFYEPMVDKQQDVKLLSWGVANSRTYFSFSRPLTNCDGQDFDIDPNHPLFVIFAYGYNNYFDYHGNNRGPVTLDLWSGDPTPIPTAEYSLEVRMPNHTVGPGTSYLCRVGVLPNDTAYHAVRIRPLKQTPLVHHMLIYMCETHLDYVGAYDCSKGMESACGRLFASYAPGVDDFILPEGVGMPMGAGEPWTIVLEIHYDNPAWVSGVVDDSGFEIFYTPNLREHSSGVMLLGIHFDDIKLDPGKAWLEKTNECPGECTAKFPHPINVFAFSTHLHVVGRAMWVQHVVNETEQEEILHVDYYHFNYQRLQQLRNKFVINPGDRLITHCVWDTRSRSNLTGGGFETKDEMCVAVLFYYPRVDTLVCIDISNVMKENGLTLQAAVCDNFIINPTVDDNFKWDFPITRFNDMPYQKKVNKTCKPPIAITNNSQDKEDDRIEKIQLPDRKTAVDYIIVGGGTAGCLLANRLSADPSMQVLLLESGIIPSTKDWEVLAVPRQAHDALQLPVSRHLYSYPVSTMMNKRLELITGSTLGGTSLINAGVWQPPHPQEIDEWNVPGLSGVELLSYLSEIENTTAFTGNSSSLYGAMDTKIAASHTHLDLWLQALQQSGIPIASRDGKPWWEGFGKIVQNIKEGKRADSFTTYAKELILKKRPNLIVMPSAKAVHLLRDELHHDIIRGVRVQVFGYTIELNCKREVILSAGVYDSPHLLMTSGIGPRADLEDKEIDVHSEVPGVGQNLVLSPSLSMIVELNETPDEKNPRKLASWQTAYDFNKTGAGLLTYPIIGAMGGYRTRYAPSSLPDTIIEYTTIAPFLEAPLNSYLVTCRLPKPLSKSSIKLVSGSVQDLPSVHSDMLSSQYDLSALYDCFTKIRNITRHPLLVNITKSEIAPGDSVKTEIELWGYLLGATKFSGYAHGTCRMGGPNDPLAVVDGEYRVRGYQNLRVVDASVIPSLSSPTQATVYLLAERAAKLMLQKPFVYPRQPEGSMTRNIMYAITTIVLAIPLVFYICLRFNMMAIKRRIVTAQEEYNVITALVDASSPYTAKASSSERKTTVRLAPKKSPGHPSTSTNQSQSSFHFTFDRPRSFPKDHLTGRRTGSPTPKESQPSTPKEGKLPESKDKRRYSFSKSNTLGEDAKNTKLCAGSNLVFSNLSYDIGTSETHMTRLLSNCYGEIHSGDMVAILGPSGAGKTTLLKLLASRPLFRGDKLQLQNMRLNDRTQGFFAHYSVLYTAHHKPIDVRFAGGDAKRNSAFVAQHTQLYGTLTVRQAYLYRIWMLNAESSDIGLIQRVELIIKEVGLTNRADTEVELLSGGERQRFNVGLQLLMLPSLIFLDEPTAALDSTTALSLILLLKEFTHSGRTIVMSIHQPRPEIFALFDKVILLAGNGSQVFEGPRKELVRIVDEHRGSSPLTESHEFSYADYLMDLITKNDKTLLTLLSHSAGPDREKLLTKTPVLEQAPYAIVPRKDPDSLMILSLQLDRIVASYPMALYHGYSIATFFCATLLGTIFYQVGYRDIWDMADRVQFLYFLFNTLAFSGTLQVPIAFANEDKKELLSERADNVITNGIFWLRSLVRDSWVVFCGCFVECFILFAFANARATQEALLGTFLVFLLSANLMVSIASVFALFMETNYATIASGCYFLLNMVFSGVIRKVDSLPAGWIWAPYVLPQYWATSAVLKLQFENLEMQCEPLDDLRYCSSGNQYLKDIGFEDAKVSLSLLVMLVMYIFTRITIYFFLKWTTPPELHFEQENAKKIDISTLTAFVPKVVSNTFYRVRAKSMMVPKRPESDDGSPISPLSRSPSPAKCGEEEKRLLKLPTQSSYADPASLSSSQHNLPKPASTESGDEIHIPRHESEIELTLPRQVSAQSGGDIQVMRLDKIMRPHGDSLPSTDDEVPTRM